MKKACIDTNIIVRHFVDADTKLLDTISKSQEAHISLPIWFEVVYVLERIYNIPRGDIIKQLTVLFSEQSVVCSRELLGKIFTLYGRQKSLSIIDCFLIVYCTKHRLTLVTHDKALKNVVVKKA